VLGRAVVNYDGKYNVLAGIALFIGASLFAGFLAALMGSNSAEVARALAPVVAAIIGGGFVLTATLIAWRSVQKKIDAEEDADRRKFQLAVTAELLVFSSPIIRATSDWNARAHQNSASIPERWPKLNRPHVYEALVDRIGLLDDWVASTVIGFYGNVLDLNELSEEAMHDRPTVGANHGTIAGRFQDMANGLALALDGLRPNRPFPIVGHDLNALVTPNGATVAGSGTAPTTLQGLLRALGGQPPTST
jgi:hypothetical protein